jgi:F0F1-type ATP synthase assembly protein I
MTGDERPERERSGAGREPATEDERQARSSAATFAGAGLQFAAAILVFLFAGQWLDRRLGMKPVFTLLGVFVGAIGGFLALYRRLTEAQRREDAARRR